MAVKVVRRAVRGLAKVPSDALSRELDRRRKVASQLEAKRTTLQAQLDDLDREIGGYGGRSAPVGGNDHPRNGNRLTLADALAKLLKGKTMSVTDATEAVKKAGYRTKSKNFRIQVNAVLLKGGFRRLGWGQYTAR